MKNIFVIINCILCLFIFFIFENISAEEIGNIEKICNAIESKSVLKFNYKGEMRLIEPHQLAYNKANRLMLSAYWIGGYSKSGNALNRWRIYLVNQMAYIIVMEQHFSGSRPGYKRTPNKLFKKAICQL